VCVCVSVTLSRSSEVNFTKNYTLLYLYLLPLLSVNSPTSQTPQLIFTLDSLKDANLRKDVPFGGLADEVTFMDLKSPKTPILGAWISISSQICEKFRSSDLCTRLTWNLTGSCGQQQRLRGWSRMVVNNSKMADGRHFENCYIAISQRKIIRFSWNFVHSSRFWTGWTSRDQKWKKLHRTDSEFERTYFLFSLNYVIISTNNTSSSAVAKRSRDASCQKSKRLILLLQHIALTSLCS